MNKRQAIKHVMNMSNGELENLIGKFGYNNSVNMFTRGIIESKVIEKINEYSDDEISRFIEDNF